MRSLPILIVLIAGTAFAQPAPQRIPPPDSDDYCHSLIARVAAAPVNGNADVVRDLASEGETLCANGQSRRGIAKLRRALRIALIHHG